MRDAVDELRAADLEPFGVNPGSAASHQAFVDEFGFPFDLLVDDGLAVAKSYGAIKSDGSGVKRTVVIVGKDGRVIYRAEGAPPPSEMLAAVRDAADHADAAS